MNAILITGNTYPNRHALRGAGGRWAPDEEGYLFPETHQAAAEELADSLGLRVRVIEVDDAALAPPSYADRRAARTRRHERNADRYASRAEGHARKEAAIRGELDRDPRASDWQFFTEPIKVGHHSEPRHRRDRARIEAKFDKAHAHWREAATLRGKALAAAAAATADADRPVAFMVRRMEELGAELRKVERTLAGETSIAFKYEGQAPVPVDPDSDTGQRLVAHRDYLAEAVAYWQALLEAAGGVTHSKDTVKPGDILRVKRGLRVQVKRANAKTVSVVYVDHPLVGWDAKIPYAEITEVLR